ncbi:MAG: murein L,D-transpeptidase family protein [Hyphomicrobiales bacterium]|nr:murein L,D-transpeptidase family protein [Hyphomicrobiales bacterium]
MRVALAVIAAALAIALYASDRLYDAAHQAWSDARRGAHRALGWPLPGTPDLSRLRERLGEKGLALGAPIFIRIFKQSRELELWMRAGESFVLFATYPICTYSGGLGPKLRQGDLQSPEGFYTAGPDAMNPNSRFRRSFNLGYPNLYDASHGRTGDFLMVHGACVSIGCYAMTDPVIDELWTIITAAFARGQARFAVHAFPFRMEDWRMRMHAGGPWADFWADLKQGYDSFERTRTPPAISVCRGRYVVRPGAPGRDAAALNAVCTS